MRTIKPVTESEKIEMWEEYQNGNCVNEISTVHSVDFFTVHSIIKEFVPDGQSIKRYKTKGDRWKMVLELYKKGERKISEFIEYSGFTEEEIKKYFEKKGHEVADGIVKSKGRITTKQKVISDLMGGMSAKEIVDKYGYTRQYVSQIKNDAIRQGFEFPLSDSKIIAQTEKELDISIIENERAIKRINRQTRDINIIKMYVQGMLYKDISEKIGYSMQLVTRVVREAIDNGTITEGRQMTDSKFKALAKMVSTDYQNNKMSNIEILEKYKINNVQLYAMLDSLEVERKRKPTTDK